MTTGWQRRLAALATMGISAVTCMGTAATASPRPADPLIVATSAYVAVGPVRLADTRQASCGCARIDDHTIRVDVVTRAGVAGHIAAAAITATIVEGSAPGYATVFPSTTSQPATSTVNA